MTLPNEVDLQQLMKNMPDTTSTMFANDGVFFLRKMRCDNVRKREELQAQVDKLKEIRGKLHIFNDEK